MRVNACHARIGLTSNTHNRNHADIIEGDPSKRTVHGGNVGRRNWSQSVDDVENAIATLPGLGFSVMRSKGHLHTVTILARIVADVSWRANNKSIDAHFNYAQFMTRVKHVSEEMGDPPSDPQHQNPAPPIVVENQRTGASSSNASSSRATSAASAVAKSSADAVDMDDDDDDVEMEGSEANPLDSSFDEGAARADLERNEAAAELRKLSIAALKERCKERDEKISGKKDDLIARLLKPRKPEILILRARRKLYVPKVPSSNAAIMVALVLHHTPGSQGMTKERLMVLAEETGVSKESMSGDGGSFYDGWSGIKQLLDGDPALVRKEKGFRYSLTTQPPNTCGIAVAKGKWAMRMLGRCAILTHPYDELLPSLAQAGAHGRVRVKTCFTVYLVLICKSFHRKGFALLHLPIDEQITLYFLTHTFI